MLRWVIIGGAVALIAVGCCLVHNSMGTDKALAVGKAGERPALAVRWTDKPLEPLARPSIKVCKSAGILTVFDGDEAIKSYRVITGAEPGDKEKEGDKRTPEGIFHVVYRNPQSKFVLSLGLDYPNTEDADRGLRAGLITAKQHDAILTAVARGQQPPWDTPLGGEIMIHGAKGDRKGTLGCVSMDDDAIRELYPKIDTGVVVEILP
jgi:murein L,D-transpeptidase YafK